MERENEVRCIAYTIWQEEGCPNGCDYKHWVRAESIWEGQHAIIAVDNSKSPLKRTAKPRTRVREASKKT